MHKMAEQISELDAVIKSLGEMQEDSTVPRNVRIKIESAISALKEEIELPIRINRAMNELAEISNDTNLQSYTRTQIWNIMSLLEKFN